MSRRATRPLVALAAARGVAVRYTDALGAERRVSDQSLLGVLRALGEPIERPQEASSLLAEREMSGAGIPAVLVAWDGELFPLELGGRPVRAEIRLEGDDTPQAVPVAEAEGRWRVAGRRHLPLGLHRLGVTMTRGGAGGGRRAEHGAEPEVEILVISAPRRAPALSRRSWGLFAPTYAISDGRCLLAGDLTCLLGAARLAGEAGAAYLATLPLLADYSAFDAPGRSVSPYSPLSRMWWNEAFVDPSRIPELRDAPPPSSPAARSPVVHLRPPSSRADVAAAGAAMRPLLDHGSAAVARAGGARLAALEAFQARRPEVLTYATFRAAAEVAGPEPAKWPATWRSGQIAAGNDLPAQAVHAHVYAQFIADEQLAAVALSASASGCRLLLDLPIGCRPDGYDPWAYPASFAGQIGGAHSARVGAPPDAFFSSGQDWGFRPLDPQGEARAGYPVVRGALRHLLRHAGALRIDHAMGLKRLWWIPEGASPAEGAYVAYPIEELLALACLEAWRHGASLVGEDLGTVEPELRTALSDHGMAGMSVAIFDLDAAPGRRPDPPRTNAAFVDTHDTATFAGWFDGTDIDDRERLGIAEAAQAATERAARARARTLLVRRLVKSGRLDSNSSVDPVEVHAALLEELGESEAATVIVTLEDLWGEHDPQNIPGTAGEHVNFARRLARSLDELTGSGHELEALARLDRARRHGHGHSGEPGRHDSEPGRHDSGEPGPVR